DDAIGFLSVIGYATGLCRFAADQTQGRRRRIAPSVLRLETGVDIAGELNGVFQGEGRRQLRGVRHDKVDHVIEGVTLIHLLADLAGEFVDVAVAPLGQGPRAHPAAPATGRQALERLLGVEGWAPGTLKPLRDP